MMIIKKWRSTSRSSNSSTVWCCWCMKIFIMNMRSDTRHWRKSKSYCRKRWIVWKLAGALCQTWRGSVIWLRDENSIRVSWLWHCSQSKKPSSNLYPAIVCRRCVFNDLSITTLGADLLPDFLPDMPVTYSGSTDLAHKRWVQSAPSSAFRDIFADYTYKILREFLATVNCGSVFSR